MKNFLKTLLVFICGAAVVGFGLCGLWGFGLGVLQVFSSDSHFAPLFLIPGAAGLLIAGISFAILRSLSRPDSDEKNDSEP